MSYAKRAVPFVGFLIVLVSALSAQIPAGHYVAPATSSSVLVVAPGGQTATTLAKLFAQPQGLIMAPDNVDLVASGGPGLMLVTPSGVATTFASVPVNEKIAMDQDGSFLLPGPGTSGSALRRLDTGLNVTTIASFGPGKGRVVAVDIDSGDYLAGDFNLYRITFGGVVTSVTTPFTVGGPTGMFSDARTGRLITGTRTAVVAVDPVGGAVTTLAQLPASVSGVAYDRANDLFVVTGLLGLTPNASGIYTVDRNGTVVSLTRLAGLQDAVVYGSRNIVGGSDPAPGQTLSLSFVEPGSPNAIYLAAASFGARPGIPTPAGTIDLVPDALFTLSQLAPSIFIKFNGTLDARGTAVGAVVVPPIQVLQGLRFYVSFVTVSGNAIKAVANTAGFTIR